MSKLGVAILGLDHWYAAFAMAPQIIESELTRLVVISHDDGAKAEKAGREFGGAEATTDYRQALDRPDVDLVVVLYSTDRNVAICKEAAALGKQIISVKPMALDLKSADELVAAVKVAGVHFFPLESQRRISPDGLRLKSWIDEGRIGQPLRYTHTLNSSLPMAWPGVMDDAGWWTDPARVPGGAWLDHSIYAIDTARWLFGSEMASVSGIAGNKRHADLKVEDYGLALYELANGTVASIEDTWTADRGYGFARNELIGSGGAVMEEGYGSKLTVKGKFGYDGWLTMEGLRDRASVVDHVVRCVRGEEAPAATVEDGRTNLAACLAFYRAAKERTVERIEA